MTDDTGNLASADNAPSRKTLEGPIEALKGKKLFADVRLMLEEALKTIAKGKDYDWAAQQLALCTYKDTQLRPEVKFRKALEILQGIGLNDPATNDPETLGMGGAVYKRMWELDGNEAHLRAAMGLYRAGWERNPDDDKGYCGGNAAYLLDLLAYLAERTARLTGVSESDALQLRLEAEYLRREMLRRLSPPAVDSKDYWLLVTFAEIHFGLGEYEEVSDLLNKARELAGGSWKFETTVIQLLNLARWRNVIDHGTTGAAFVAETSEAMRCRKALTALLGDDLDAALGCFRGRVGLALSGGGFRAAFFHLGLLARLAEIDALRHVEVLSTVSGGSIVGVHYYLELKLMLEGKPDKSIVREDYIEIVRRVQENFRKSVQRNMRMRILNNLCRNLRMLFTSRYTRSHRIGELYEKEIYSRVADGNSSCKPRTMPSLLIRPNGLDSPQDFKPRAGNWLRMAKVPELVVNTTSLNSGHNFQFTASWLGEPPGLTGAEVDMNVRHRRLYYTEAPTEETREFRLGYAVAASSCVPGMFDPLVIKGLYPGRTVKLVDGGVHDNQGIAGLLDEGCDFIICSDASGQMHDDANPSTSFIGVPLRSNDILMDRVRECEYDHLEAMTSSGRLKGLFFIHLKKDLAQEDIGWVGSPEKTPPPQPNQTPYGIDRDIQRSLSEIRTDLDAFSEVEAQSLMLSGYLMAEEHAKALNRDFKENGGAGSWGGFDIDAPRGDWPFLQLEPIAAKPCDSSDLRRQDLEKQLTVGKELFLKAWHLVPWLRVLGRALIALLVIGAAAFGWWCWAHPEKAYSFTLWDIVLTVTGILVSLILPSWIALTPQKAWKQFLVRACLAVLGWVVATAHLVVIDPLFLGRGRLKRLLRLPGDN